MSGAVRGGTAELGTGERSAVRRTWPHLRLYMYHYKYVIYFLITTKDIYNILFNHTNRLLIAFTNDSKPKYSFFPT